jgi:hypothetical protein
MAALLRRAAPLAVTVAVAMALAMSTSTNAAPTPDSAVIVDSGSTNTAGYTIVVSSEGTGRITLQSRAGRPASSAPKTFAIAAAVTTRFFAALKAAQAAKVVGAPCMKSASFGTSTHVSWHDWKSPDLDCPSENALLSAVIKDVNAIRAASGVGAMPGTGREPEDGGPLHAEPPSPSPHAPSPDASPDKGEIA